MKNLEISSRKDKIVHLGNLKIVKGMYDHQS